MRASSGPPGGPRTQLSTVSDARAGSIAARRSCAVVAVGLAAGLASGLMIGCQSFTPAEPIGPDYMAIFGDRGAGRIADVHVFREENRVLMSNTTLEAFGPGRLWLNGQFSRPIDGIAINETLELRLDGFANRFGERFRGGGFFASKPPDPLVLVEYERFPGETGPAGMAEDAAPGDDMPASELIGFVIVEDLY